MSECIYTQEQFDKILKERNQLANENFKLKQQLAEKEKEFDWLHKKFAKYAESNQDKISFCIEQLEKIKKWIHEHRVIPFFEERYIVYVKSLNNEIDNQIEELKKEIENGN